MFTEIILAVISFTLVALVLAAVASRNKLIAPAVEKEVAVIATHNKNTLAWLKAAWKHVTDWLEVYWWLPLSVLAVAGAAKLVFLFTGRATVEDANALVGFALRIPPVIVALCVMTITRQQSAHFLTVEEAKLHVPLVAVYHAKDALIFALVLYFFLH